MTAIVMVKRRAKEGEWGLFVNAEVFEEEFSNIPAGIEIDVEATARGTEKYMRLSHVIAKTVFDNSELFASKEDARESILIDCRHVRRVMYMGKAELRAKPTRDLDVTAWLRLIRLMIDVAVRVHGIPPETFEKDRPDARPEPPPHDTVPEGPGSGPATVDEAIERRMEEARAEQRPDAPVDDGRDLDDDGDMDAGEPEATETAPEARQAAAPAAARDNPGRSSVVWTVDMTGEPDWSKDLPGDKGMYAAYARAKLERTTDKASWIVWWSCDDEFNRRIACGVGVMDRKQIEKLAAEKEWLT